jgi:hypothetical protein
MPNNRARLTVPRVLPPTGKGEQAREHLATATAMYREMGMRVWFTRAEADSCAS